MWDLKLPDGWTGWPEAQAVLRALVAWRMGWALADDRESSRLYGELRSAELALMTRLELSDTERTQYRQRKEIEEQVRAAFRRAG